VPVQRLCLGATICGGALKRGRAWTEEVGARRGWIAGSWRDVSTALRFAQHDNEAWVPGFAGMTAGGSCVG
jgi:hypothetical protein